ncbi:MAG TPA: tRNA (5-methylaminomethyl-2-thiouridine)(34)-methyltransferase MnmD [Hyphomonadaceae bacterium]|jgi:tRNA 5-methylaminomethyl-2-thiouridine biosynthesis bifunctional protein|nr:tRNA (5-methylaminomethyl-2-thiouridine)(34)-methyltransferase MnmD [Hyphomonadaceae bacterium]
MARLSPLPQLDWSDDAPFSREKGDVYFSEDGLSEKRHVFLTGCGLPERWAGLAHFTIGELGFGTGLNLLAAMELWRAHRPSPGARLDFLSFEGALMSVEDAARVHARWPEMAGLSGELISRWPVRARGVQRIAFPDGVTLTLFVDEIAAALPQARASVDAWFLDGFAPSKNAEMWSAEVMAQVARLSATGARAATYTVAGDVRRNLEAAGFAVEKRPGHGRKKERLEASYMGAASAALHPRSVAIIGAGIAGACAAHAFLRRGCSVTVYDKAPAPGAGASGNPLALVMPRLDAADGPQARALLAAYLYAQRFYRELGPDAAAPLDAEHRAKGEKERARFEKLLADPPVDDALLAAIDAGDPGAGVIHRGAIAVRPSVALPALLSGATLRIGEEVMALDAVEADLVIVCAGMGSAGIRGIEAPPLEGRLGQLESAASSGGPRAVADGGYAVEAFGQLVFGATFEKAEGEPRVTDAARAQNLETLARLRPDLAPTTVTSRAAIRATTQDRFPFAGAPLGEMAPQNEKVPGSEPAPSTVVRLIGGLGARGFLWAPLLAELLASEVFNEPSPLEASAAKTVDPGRFLLRAARRVGA